MMVIRNKTTKVLKTTVKQNLLFSVTHCSKKNFAVYCRMKYDTI